MLIQTPFTKIINLALDIEFNLWLKEKQKRLKRNTKQFIRNLCISYILKKKYDVIGVAIYRILRTCIKNLNNFM